MYYIDIKKEYDFRKLKSNKNIYSLCVVMELINIICIDCIENTGYCNHCDLYPLRRKVESIQNQCKKKKKFNFDKKNNL